MKQWMYRGNQPIKHDGHVIRFGDIVGDDHVAIQQGWNGFVPVQATEGSVPDAVEAATVVEVDGDLGFEPEELTEL